MTEEHRDSGVTMIFKWGKRGIIYNLSVTDQEKKPEKEKIGYALKIYHHQPLNLKLIDGSNLDGQSQNSPTWLRHSHECEKLNRFQIFQIYNNLLPGLLPLEDIEKSF
jgi:hypothetical protein